jgi:AraC family transcriptional regulator
MPGNYHRVQPIMAHVARHLEGDLSLSALARRARMSRFHLQRLFSATTRETLKQYTARLRLDRAATALLNGRDSVLSIALSSGFSNHETFCRAFQRRFGMTPTAYRRRGLAAPAGELDAARHATSVTRAGPCIGLLHSSVIHTSRGHDMPYSIARQQLAPQPVLVIRKRVPRADIAKEIGATLGRIFQYAQSRGAAFAGQPLTRYLDWGPGVLTLEMGMPIVAALTVDSASDVRADVLPGGPAAVTTHLGPYDKLSEAHAAVQIWMEENGLRAAGSPWEVYVSDPAEVADPARWRTDIFWPLER